MNYLKIRKPLVVFLAYIVFSNLFVGIASGLIEGFRIENVIFSNILLSIGSLLSLLLVMYISKDTIEGQFKKYLKDFKKNIGSILKIWGIGFLLMCIANFIINFIIMGDIAPNEEANRALIAQFPFYSIINVCIVAPFAEEIIFRLNLKPVFKKDEIFILVSGVVFGLMHVVMVDFSLANLIYIVPYSILGISFAKIYSKTGSVFSSITAHALHNTVGIVVILLGV